ncbi:uncharacterized protein LOC112690263 isoform X2 [Sipha flava]|uniref:Uncharacterized protein LOC112690263 isoform X2 n=1 Tax=Sipha flava TaxID=143950 RepID=A0A8B8GBM2_9HEMI|nr:uncharacterized protein LOC112690263 isoform X2 [Sipha flava]
MSVKRKNVFSIFNMKKKCQEVYSDAPIKIDKAENEELTIPPTTSITIKSIEPDSISKETDPNENINETVVDASAWPINDIANFIRKQQLNAKEIYNCLTLEWKPSANYVFPECIEGKQKRRFLHKYLTIFPWLAYSKYKEGAYCKYCIVFAFSGGGVGHQKLGKIS